MDWLDRMIGRYGYPAIMLGIAAGITAVICLVLILALAAMGLNP